MEPWLDEEDNSSETTPESWYRSNSEVNQEVFDVVIENEVEDNQ